MKFNHIGIPTTGRFEGEIDLPHLRITVSDHQSNPFGIQWQRYWEGASVPDLVKTVACGAKQITDWSRDGRYLLYRTVTTGPRADNDI